MGILRDFLDGTIADKIVDGLEKYHKGFVKSKILRTMEEVEANTNETNLVSAPVIRELNDNLVSNIYVGTDGKLHKVQGGADTVLPFSNINTIRINWSASGYRNYGAVSNHTISGTAIYTRNGNQWVKSGDWSGWLSPDGIESFAYTTLIINSIALS